MAAKDAFLSQWGNFKQPLSQKIGKNTQIVLTCIYCTPQTLNLGNVIVSIDSINPIDTIDTIDTINPIDTIVSIDV